MILGFKNGQCGQYQICILIKPLIWYKTRFWIISYVCVLHFLFPSKFLILTPNPSHYTSKSPCSFPNGLLFTLKRSSDPYMWALSHLSVVGGGECCACKTHCAKLLGGVDLNEWGCTDVRETILAREIYCVNTNPEPYLVKLSISN